jgi:hypothetical protein
MYLRSRDPSPRRTSGNQQAAFRWQKCEPGPSECGKHQMQRPIKLDICAELPILAHCTHAYWGSTGAGTTTTTLTVKLEVLDNLLG